MLGGANLKSSDWEDIISAFGVGNIEDKTFLHLSGTLTARHPLEYRRVIYVANSSDSPLNLWDFEIIFMHLAKLRSRKVIIAVLSNNDGSPFSRRIGSFDMGSLPHFTFTSIEEVERFAKSIDEDGGDAIAFSTKIMFNALSKPPF